MLKILEFELIALFNFTLTEKKKQRLSQTSQLIKKMKFSLSKRYAKIMIHLIKQQILKILIAFARTNLKRKTFAYKHYNENFLIANIDIRLKQLCNDTIQKIAIDKEMKFLT